MPGQTIEKTLKICVEDVLLTRGGWKSALVTCLDVETAKLDVLLGNVKAALVEEIQKRAIRSIAIPPLGCGNGGLD